MLLSVKMQPALGVKHSSQLYHGEMKGGNSRGEGQGSEMQQEKLELQQRTGEHTPHPADTLGIFNNQKPEPLV